MAAVMRAADRIAANVMVAKPQLRDGLYRIPRRFGRVSKAEKAQSVLDWVEQMARRLVAMRLANLLETTEREEQRA
jgi:hypothetical protein